MDSPGTNNANEGEEKMRIFLKTGQEKAREFAGQKVKITGRVSGKTIRVSSIETAA